MCDIAYPAIIRQESNCEYRVRIIGFDDCETCSTEYNAVEQAAKELLDNRIDNMIKMGEQLPNIPSKADIERYAKEYNAQFAAMIKSSYKKRIVKQESDADISYLYEKLSYPVIIYKNEDGVLIRFPDLVTDIYQLGSEYSLLNDMDRCLAIAKELLNGYIKSAVSNKMILPKPSKLSDIEASYDKDNYVVKNIVSKFTRHKVEIGDYSEAEHMGISNEVECDTDKSGISYPVIFHKEGYNRYWAEFPDFENLVTSVCELEMCEVEAKSILSEEIGNIVRAGEELPRATDIGSIKLFKGSDSDCDSFIKIISCAYAVKIVKWQNTDRLEYKEMKLGYPAIFHPTHKQIWVEFTDLHGCETFAVKDSLEQCIEYAKEELNSFLKSELENGEKLKKPSDVSEIAKKDESDIIMMVYSDFDKSLLDE